MPSFLGVLYVFVWFSSVCARDEKMFIAQLKGFPCHRIFPWFFARRRTNDGVDVLGPLVVLGFRGNDGRIPHKLFRHQIYIRAASACAGSPGTKRTFFRSDCTVFALTIMR